MYFSQISSPIGKLTLASDSESITGLWIEGQKYFPQNLLQNYTRRDDLPVVSKCQDWLELYFNRKNPPINDLPLNPTGTPFQKQVWEILKTIPYGQTTTYKEIANIIANRQNKKSMSAQAVGFAIGHNPISIIIPCHRVIGTDGSLTGYAGGLKLKEYMLRLEKALPAEKLLF